MATTSPDVAWRISEKYDLMITAMMSGMGLSTGNHDTLLQNVKTELDANFASFKDPATGDYTVPHVRAAFTRVMNRGK